MGENLELPGPSEATLSRRRLLQAGVATGVVAATWSAPTIVAAATTPGNGAVCTVPPAKFFDSGKKNMTCESGCTDSSGTTYLTYHTPYPGGDFQIDFPGTSCSAPPGPAYTITFSKGKGPGPGYTCYIGSFRVFNQPHGVDRLVTGVPGGIAPPIAREFEGDCAWFYGDVTVECCPTGNLH